MLGKEFFMNCKFHPTAEAVTTCATCGAGMCASCETGAFFHTEDDKPLCLECSLKEAEDDLAAEKLYQKRLWRDGIIASIIWMAGVFLGAMYEVLYLLMLVAAIFLYKSSLFASDERGFFEKLKAIFWKIILGTLLLPIMFVFLLICGKWDKIKANKKVNRIKAAMGNAN